LYVSSFFVRSPTMIFCRKHSATRESMAGYTMGARIFAVGGRSPGTEPLADGRCVSVSASDLSEAVVIDGAIVEAIDMVLILSLPVEDTMLVVLVCVPGGGGA
jgi:hypothetical protein